MGEVGNRSLQYVLSNEANQNVWPIIQEEVCAVN